MNLKIGIILFTVETGELNKNEKVYFGTIEENAQEGDEVYLNVPLVVDEGTKFAGGE